MKDKMNHPPISRIFANWNSVSRKFAKFADHLVIFAIRIWRVTISPAQIFLFGPDAGCRFTPSCSAYALEAVERHGAVSGSWLTAKRICRCHPWGDCGDDPVTLPNSAFRTPNSELISHGS